VHHHRAAVRRNPTTPLLPTPHIMSPPAINVGYNNKGEVVNVDHSNNTFDKSYDFDGIGNRKSSTEDGATTNYTVNALNQYTAVGVAAQSYDEDGNKLETRITAHGSPATSANLEWNGNNRLTRATLDTGKTIHFEYDHMGRRYRKVVTENNVSSYTYWIYDGYNAIAKYTRSNGASEASLAKTYYWGNKLLVERDAVSGEDFFPITDGNKNITEYLDSTGAVVMHQQYDAFGKVLVSSGSKKDDVDYGFSSEVVDRDLGLSYYNYRYYDANQGRWLSRDPIGERGGVNIYAFAGNDGIGALDYLGLAKIRITKPNAAGRQYVEYVPEGLLWWDLDPINIGVYNDDETVSVTSSAFIETVGVKKIDFLFLDNWVTEGSYEGFLKAVKKEVDKHTVEIAVNHDFPISDKTKKRFAEIIDECVKHCSCTHKITYTWNKVEDKEGLNLGRSGDFLGFWGEKYNLYIGDFPELKAVGFNGGGVTGMWGWALNDVNLKKMKEQVAENFGDADDYLATVLAHELVWHGIGGTTDASLLLKTDWDGNHGKFVDDPNASVKAKYFSKQACKEICDEMDIDVNVKE